MSRPWAVLAVMGMAVSVAGAACSSSSSSSSPDTRPKPAKPVPNVVPALHGSVHVSVKNAAHCSAYATRTCLSPFPDDQFTMADATMDTGRRVNIAQGTTPTNKDGVSVNPLEWNRNDGFSPGQALMVFLPNLDIGKSKLAPVTDIGASLKDDAPIVVMDAKTGEHKPYFAELDAGTAAKGEKQPALFVRPAVNWEEGHRYLVAFRTLKDAHGKALPVNPVFAAFRDGVKVDDPKVEARRAHANEVFAQLASHGIGRAELSLAWDFTVASTKNLTSRMLHIRDEAMAKLGADGAPRFRLTVTPAADTASGDARVVEGTFDVPLYLDRDGAPGSRFIYADADPPLQTKPLQNGMYTAKFTCVLPYVAHSTKPTSAGGGVAGSLPPGGAQAVVYGHGLLGSRNEVLGFGKYAIVHKSVLCATDWIGLAEDDLGEAVKVLQDLSNLSALADRSQQGFLNFQYLARLMKSPKGLVSDPTFQLGASGKPLIATGDVAFWGRSQGGIYGGAATAISTEWTRAVLGEPGMNYSTLLGRSVDFDKYAVIEQASYKDKTDWPVLDELLQMTWDRGEPDGYAAHLTDHPLPGTPKHTVMLFEAFGDHQVTNVATEVEARTIGARLKQPALGSGRSKDKKPFWDLAAFDKLPADGSVLYVWDFGTPRPPAVALPNRAGDDPHDMDKDTPEAMDVVAAFLAKGGRVIDACDGDPCHAQPVKGG